MPPRTFLTTTLALLAIGLLSAQVTAQELPELVGPARDVARSEILYPTVLDPLLRFPLTATPQAVIDFHGRDIVAAAHAGIRTGDNNYGITVSIPLSQGDATVMDTARMRKHVALSFDLNNLIWHPKATPELERQIGPDGFLRLSRESREAVAQALTAGDVVSVPWALFVHGSYGFSRGEFSYEDPTTHVSQTVSHLTDNGSLLVGSQFLITPDDPGYFVAFSYTYSSIFRDADLANGVRTTGPLRTKGNIMRVEARRLLPSGLVGINPSFSIEDTTNVKAFEVAAYAQLKTNLSDTTRNSTRFYGGLRLGYETGGGGFYASVFVGPTLGSRP